MGQLRALMSLDWWNAFNLIDCVHTTCCIATCASGLTRLYKWLYCLNLILVLPPLFKRAGLLALLLSQAGVHQGDMLSLLFFVIGAEPILLVDDCAQCAPMGVPQ